jgi:hypothetical protein
MVESPSSAAEGCGGQSKEVIGLRVSALEVRVAAEAASVTLHFAELKDFVSFTVTSQLTQLRTDVRRDLRRVEQRLDKARTQSRGFHRPP